MTAKVFVAEFDSVAERLQTVNATDGSPLGAELIPATRKKLREAQFFLSQLQGEVTSIDAGQTDQAEFFFSACLSAARSVTFVLEAEKPTKYTSWSPNWRATLSERETSLARRFVEARNRALK